MSEGSSKILVSELDSLPSVAHYLQRIGASPRSLFRATVREAVGAYWRDVAAIKFNKADGTVTAPAGYEPTEAEAAQIKAEWAERQWPSSCPAGVNTALPEALQGVDPETLYLFRGLDGRLIAIQQRIDDPTTGEKTYRFWSYWDDQRWRQMEPEGKLSLYGLEKIGNHTTVFIHEGSKAARAVQRLIAAATAEEKAALAAHPWGIELQGAAHLGWASGALSPSRTDWGTLQKAGVKRAYIVADNDMPGKAAVPSIARALRVVTFSVEFTDQWPASFDLADSFPESMFKQVGGRRHYVGPSFRSRCQPATFMTDQLENPSGKGRPIVTLRPHAVGLWQFNEEGDSFVHSELGIVRGAPVLNGMLAPFSQAKDTATIIQRAYAGPKVRLTYRPFVRHSGAQTVDKSTDDGQGTAINVFEPPDIRPVAGDPSPWLEFLTYLFPTAADRHEVMRWCATLIAQPELRVLYGLLLMSEHHGTGKNTLATVMARQVGERNTSFPGANDILGSFNSWVAMKRLVVVGEIYAGSNFKAYNGLKTLVTDRHITVNEKFQRAYLIENWAHFILCSNSKKALKIDEDDRRWLVPKVAEAAWPKAKFAAFYAWLAAGGDQIILQWALDFADYVSPSDRAPATESKAKLARASKSEDWQCVSDEAARLCDAGAVGVYSAKEVRDRLLAGAQGRRPVFDDEAELGKALIAGGMRRVQVPGLDDYRVRVDGKRQRAVATPAALAQLAPLIDAAAHAAADTTETARVALDERVKAMLLDQAKPKFNLEPPM